MPAVADIRWRCRTGEKYRQLAIVSFVVWIVMANPLLWILGAKLELRESLAVMAPPLLFLLIALFDPAVVRTRLVSLTAEGLWIRTSDHLGVLRRGWDRKTQEHIAWDRVRRWRLACRTRDGRTRCSLTLKLRHRADALTLPIPDADTASRIQAALERRLPGVPCKRTHIALPSRDQWWLLAAFSAVWLAGIVVMGYANAGIIPSDWPWPALIMGFGPGLPWAVWVTWRGSRPAVVWPCLGLLINLLLNLDGLLVAKLIHAALMLEVASK